MTHTNITQIKVIDHVHKISDDLWVSTIPESVFAFQGRSQAEAVGLLVLWLIQQNQQLPKPPQPQEAKS